MSNISQYLANILAARYGKDVRQSIHDAIKEVDRVADTAQDSATASAKVAAESEKKAAESAENASTSAGAAAESAENAAESAESAAGSVAAVEESARDAAESEKNAQTSAEAAAESAKNAAVSAASATGNAEATAESERNATVSAESAKVSASVAAESEKKAAVSAENASGSATAAESYACGGTGTRDNETVDNAKYYKEQAERVAEGLKGSLLPMGTILFAELPDSPKVGYMYNILDEFVTTERFKEGAGNTIPAGTNVYYTADEYWDCMAGSPVAGVKGAKEDVYRRGNVNITAKDVGALTEDGDTAENTVTFTSSDNDALEAWTDVEVLGSGEKHSSLFNKISVMFKNVRWLYMQMGELKKFVGDGKSKVASAITAQGVSTEADATFDTIAANISKVGSDKYEDGKKSAMVGTATAGNVLSGKTFTNTSQIGASGSMPNRGAWTANTVNGNNVAIPAGYHNGSGYVSGSGAFNAGVTAADNRANPNSVNYKTGYNAGYAVGQGSVSVSRQELVGQVTINNGGGEGTPIMGRITLNASFAHGIAGLVWYQVDGQGQKFGIHSVAVSGNQITLEIGNTISWWSGTVTVRATVSGY